MIQKWSVFWGGPSSAFTTSHSAITILLFQPKFQVSIRGHFPAARAVKRIGTRLAMAVIVFDDVPKLDRIM